MCSHGLAETGDGHLRVAFSDQMTSLETLLEENMKSKNLLLIIVNLKTLKTEKTKDKYFIIFASQYTVAKIYLGNRKSSSSRKSSFLK